MSEQAYQLQCMEIWGGNRAEHNALSTPGLDIWVHAEPYGQSDAGGDIHYVSACASGRMVRLAVADVSGHGADVSDLATTLRGFMRKNINTIDQRRMTRQLNGAFHEASSDGKFATALTASYFSPTDELIMVNAGHPRPMLYRAEEDRWSVIDTALRSEGKASGLPLGVIEPTEYAQQAVKLGIGDLVLLYTDSITECRDGAGKMLGESGLVSLLEELGADTPETLVDRLVQRIKGLHCDEPLDDDLTVVLLHHNGGEPERQGVGEMMSTVAKLLGLKKV